jgi:hypothetical protein
MIVEKQMECRLAGETEVLGENLPQRHFCPSQNPAAAVGSRRLTDIGPDITYGERQLTRIILQPVRMRSSGALQLRIASGMFSTASCICQLHHGCLSLSVVMLIDIKFDAKEFYTNLSKPNFE